MNTAIELAHAHMTCDIFVFTHGGPRTPHYKNLATLSDLAKKSSGNLFYYPDYNARTLAMKFSNELYHSLTRKTAWEAVFRIRTSFGFQ